MKVWINDKDTGKRKVVEAELLKTRPTTVVVKLADGNVIVRKKSRDVVVEGK